MCAALKGEHLVSIRKRVTPAENMSALAPSYIFSDESNNSGALYSSEPTVDGFVRNNDD